MIPNRAVKLVLESISATPAGWSSRMRIEMEDGTIQYVTQTTSIELPPTKFTIDMGEEASE